MSREGADGNAYATLFTRYWRLARSSCCSGCCRPTPTLFPTRHSERAMPLQESHVPSRRSTRQGELLVEEYEGTRMGAAAFRISANSPTQQR